MSIRPAFRILLGLTALVLLPGVAYSDSSYCSSGKPESVIACLSAAYEARDVAAYSRLLAPDFRFRFIPTRVARKKGNQKETGWSRDEDIQGTRALFTSEDIQSIRNSIAAPNPPVETGPGTWEISGIVVDLEVQKMTPGSEPFKVHSTTQVLKIREVAAPEPHFEIYEWTDQME